MNVDGSALKICHWRKRMNAGEEERVRDVKCDANPCKWMT